MAKTREIDPLFGELFLAGESVPPGEYREINGGRLVVLKTVDTLPASLDGHVACYRRLAANNFAVVQHQPRSEQANHQRA